MKHSTSPRNQSAKNSNFGCFKGGVVIGSALSKGWRSGPSRFAAVTSKEISQLINQAVPEIHEEGDEVRF